MLTQALDFARGNQARFLNEYKALLRIPSISTLPERREDVRRAAEWLADALRRLDVDRVEVMATPGHPIVCGEWLHAPGKPTLLVYGHYDVQPADPLNEWHSDPFEPTERDGNLYARGASDMKGALVASLKAMESLRAAGGLPVNLRFLLEGEEEIGSPSLPGFFSQHADLLKADAALNCDGEILRPDLPSITYALRGLAYFEVEVCGPKQDLHSGIFGGAVHNPAQVLCELIAGMHDTGNRVTLPGFYDTVRPLDAGEREALARTPVTDDDWKTLAGVTALWGEKGYTATECTGARPTLEVNGIVGGFTGDGAKTVLPARALAKISTRLVADQDPAAIREQLCAYMHAHAPETVTWDVRELSHGDGAIMDRNSPAMRAAVRALHETFGAEPIFTRDGGSVPVVAMMQKELHVDSVMIGFRLPDDNIHAPNEKQHLPTWYKGIEAFIRYLMEYS
ncbi:MAG: dipeptidase [Candidatus Hydrogenedentes bacterium]|nr:dipeptidase [Candidatus Hydrogenedentota bacterium]